MKTEYENDLMIRITSWYLNPPRDLVDKMLREETQNQINYKVSKFIASTKNKQDLIDKILGSKEDTINDIKLLGFIYLALKDPYTSDQESLIELTCQYGMSYGVTPKKVGEALDKRLVDFLNEST